MIRQKKMDFNSKQPYNLKMLPPAMDFDAIPILRALKPASRELAELKGCCTGIPNPMVLMSIAMTEADLWDPWETFKNFHRVPATAKRN